MYVNIRVEASVAWYTADLMVLYIYMYISRRNGIVGHVRVLDILAYAIYLTFRELCHFVTACFLCEVLAGV